MPLPGAPVFRIAHSTSRQKWETHGGDLFYACMTAVISFTASLATRACVAGSLSRKLLGGRFPRQHIHQTDGQRSWRLLDVLLRLWKTKAVCTLLFSENENNRLVAQDVKP